MGTRRERLHCAIEDLRHYRRRLAANRGCSLERFRNRATMAGAAMLLIACTWALTVNGGWLDGGSLLLAVL